MWKLMEFIRKLLKVKKEIINVKEFGDEEMD